MQHLPKCSFNDGSASSRAGMFEDVEGSFDLWTPGVFLGINTRDVSQLFAALKRQQKVRPCFLFKVLSDE